MSGLRRPKLRLALLVVAGAGAPIEHEQQEENSRYGEQFNEREARRGGRFKRWKTAAPLAQAAHSIEPALHTAPIPQTRAAGNGEVVAKWSRTANSEKHRD